MKPKDFLLLWNKDKNIFNLRISKSQNLSKKMNIENGYYLKKA